VLEQKEVRERLFNSGVEVRSMGPEDFVEYCASEMQKWAKVMQAAGARADY
jgi:tripartite-type tricarboxylate transporter receptor subunit TctC